MTDGSEQAIDRRSLLSSIVASAALAGCVEGEDSEFVIPAPPPPEDSHGDDTDSEENSDSDSDMTEYEVDITAGIGEQEQLLEFPGDSSTNQVAEPTGVFATELEVDHSGDQDMEISLTLADGREIEHDEFDSGSYSYEFDPGRIVEIDWSASFPGGGLDAWITPVGLRLELGDEI
ncbi:hypothetical protein AB7C87_05140 [Natrarchaeobius sp. A-rgal3]|uniref:hypothetical protein n=1 Tax=Natrarchaeobius versutus TaxID=1679078 RepID=UPI00351062DA